MAEEVDDFGIEKVAFEALEKDFQEVLNELASDPSLERFRVEYEKLYRNLKSSNENEKKLLSRCQNLNNDIGVSVGKVQQALRLTQEDSQTISYLKAELEKTYKVLELSKEREEKHKQKIENLHSEIKQLKSLIEQGNSQNTGQSNTVHELIVVKGELLKETKMLETLIGNVKSELQVNQERVTMLENDKQKVEADTARLKKLIADKELKIQEDDEKKKRIQEELELIKKNHDTLRKEQEHLQEEKNTLKQEREKLEIESRELDKLKEALYREQRRSEKEKDESEKRLRDQTETNKKVEQTLFETRDNLEGLKREMRSSTATYESLLKKKNRLEDDLKRYNEMRVDAEKLADIAKLSINELERDVAQGKKSAIDDRTLLEELKRTRDILLKELNRAETNNKKQFEELLMKEKLMKEKLNEEASLKKEQDRKSKKIGALEKEREKYGIQSAQAHAKYYHSLEEIKLKDNLISEFQKKNIETEAKLKQQQNLYEAVRSDRNLYSKNLTETQEEIAEIKRRYKIITHQITQQKDEIEAKEIALMKEHIDHRKKDKTIEEQQKILEKYKIEIAEKEEKIKEFVKDIADMHYYIKESEGQRQKLKEEYDLVVAERDILGTQLIRRNEEATLLYEKIKINQSTLAKGEVQYRERLGDIELLKSTIANKLREIKLFKIHANMIPELKNEIHNLQKELIEEKLKVKALTEELENPMNVHRWRKLDATDSETYELMTKIQTLQKRLIAKTEEVVAKQASIQEKDKKLKELRDIMKRQPSIEEAKMIAVYQESLRQKNEQLRGMKEELLEFQEQVKELQFQIETLNSDLQSMKKKYYEQKKKEMMTKEKQTLTQKPTLIQVNLPDKRYTGGGFNLAV